MIGIGAIFRNEAPYLKEWIEFHRIVGVEKFFLFDNLSTDPFLEVLQPYIERGIVELTHWPLEHSHIVEWNEIQCLAYERIVHKAKDKVKWLAIIDTDEFLFSPQKDHLGDILADFEHVGGIGVNWQVFGTSSATVPPDGLLVETLNFKWPEETATNHHIKCIIRPDRVASCEDPHFVHYKPGYLQVDTTGTPFEGKYTHTIRIDRLRINHYTLRDESFFKKQKIPRLKKWWVDAGIPGHLEWEEKYIRIKVLEEKYKFDANVEDRLIHRFVPKLRQSLLRNT